MKHSGLKKIAVALILIAICVLPVSAVHSEPELSAKSAVLIDADSAQVLYAKDCDARLPVASTTKIMTALLLLEAGEPSFSFQADDAMVRVEGTSMGLKAGDTVSRYALACGCSCPAATTPPTPRPSTWLAACPPSPT